MIPDSTQSTAEFPSVSTTMYSIVVDPYSKQVLLLSLILGIHSPFRPRRLWLYVVIFFLSPLLDLRVIVVVPNSQDWRQRAF
ncbi:uncharacterized protein BO97DRAFT_165043 [Aspergillus homomorphus CBS 101889]|uniref:Uncharacterized protein n=1 Tax=Aspergillus homomorphus (strain CBS 101889) TaxID=1450537 RepID=A0A395HPS2_ASPHC|nr:hypothetical protein BO97DRAFT_165043 [Aspergillus homomorphus CBS 101889]RAL09489.1 hypothetical protein BO97DRAFT_165043 [Aspergillus homomorphus CBS 101889]